MHRSYLDKYIKILTGRTFKVTVSLVNVLVNYIQPQRSPCCIFIAQTNYDLQNTCYAVNFVMIIYFQIDTFILFQKFLNIF